MPGTWLTRIAQRLTREETFERLVSPAIADLQRQAAHGLLVRTRHYGGLAIILACALLRDFRADLALAFDGDARRRIWPRAALWSLAAGLINWSLMYMLTVRRMNQWHVDHPVAQPILNGVVFMSLGPALTAAAIVVAYYLKRRDATRTRPTYAAAGVIVAASLLVSYATMTFDLSARQALNEVTRAQFSESITVTRPPLLWQMITNAMQLVPFVWLGAVLARRRGWLLAFGITAIVGTSMLLLFSGASFRLVRMLVDLVPVLQPMLYETYFIPHNVLTMSAAILLWRMVESRIDRHQLLHGQTPYGPTRPGTV